MLDNGDKKRERINMRMGVQERMVHYWWMTDTKTSGDLLGGKERKTKMLNRVRRWSTSQRTRYPPLLLYRLRPFIINNTDANFWVKKTWLDIFEQHLRYGTNSSPSTPPVGLRLTFKQDLESGAEELMAANWSWRKERPSCRRGIPSRNTFRVACEGRKAGFIVTIKTLGRGTSGGSFAAARSSR